MDLFRKKEINTSFESESTLVKCLTAFDLTFFGIGAIIGAGIFILTGVVAAMDAGPAVIFSYVLAGFACVFSALSYAELAWGGGLGKGFFDEKGNWHGLYAIAFLDSHRNLEPTVGYAYLKVAKLTQNFKAGLGVSVLVTSRPDILHSIPFPGAVPWAGLFYKKLSLKAAYIPGSSTNGNVLYLVGAYAFDK